MKYYNGREIPNHKEVKINYFNKNKRKKTHRSTDNIFETYRGYTLHTIYNNFLVNPYLVRDSRYKIALDNYSDNSHSFRYKNSYFDNKNINSLNEPINNLKANNYMNKNIHYSENNKNQNYENERYYSPLDNLKLPRININPNNKNGNFIRRKIYEEEHKNIPFNRNNQTISTDRDYIPHYQNNQNNIKAQMSMERPIEYIIKNKNEFNDSFYTNNNDKLYLSYDNNKRKKYLNKSCSYIEGDYYISPVVAKIAKHHYLMRNPYSDKDEYLGPSRLKHNPILYPISTYKFDFDRYIRNYHVNKFV